MPQCPPGSSFSCCNLSWIWALTASTDQQSRTHVLHSWGGVRSNFTQSHWRQSMRSLKQLHCQTCWHKCHYHFQYRPSVTKFILQKCCFRNTLRRDTKLQLKSEGWREKKALMIIRKALSTSLPNTFSHQFHFSVLAAKSGCPIETLDISLFQ